MNERDDNPSNEQYPGGRPKGRRGHHYSSEESSQNFVRPHEVYDGDPETILHTGGIQRTKEQVPTDYVRTSGRRGRNR